MTTRSLFVSVARGGESDDRDSDVVVVVVMFGATIMNYCLPSVEANNSMTYEVRSKS